LAAANRLLYWFGMTIRAPVKALLTPRPTAPAVAHATRERAIPSAGPSDGWPSFDFTVRR
jgi:hypothetical protein